MPLTEPDVWISHIRLFDLPHVTRISGVEVVPDRWLRKRIMTDVFVKLCPAHTSLLAPSVQPFAHQPQREPVVAVDCAVVAAHPVVLVVPPQLGA